MPKFYWFKEVLLCKTLKCKAVYILPQLEKKREEKKPTSYRRALWPEHFGTFKDVNKTSAGRLCGYMESMHITRTFHRASLYFKFFKGRGQKRYYSTGLFCNECLQGALQFLICVVTKIKLTLKLPH